MRLFPLLFMLLCFTAVFGQTDQIDSLRRKLRHETKADTLRAFDLNELAWQFVDYSIDSAAKYAAKALHLSRKINYINGVIDARNVQGIVYRLTNESDKAIRLYEENIRLLLQQGKLNRLTGAYSNLGSVYYETRNNAKALEFYLKAYENAKKHRQLENQMILLNNLGVGYKVSGLYDQAIAAFREALVLNKQFNDNFQEAQLYLNIATVYDQQHFYGEAIRYYKHSYAIFKRDNNLRQLSTLVYNLTVSYRNNKNLQAAGTYLNEMEHIARQLNENEYTSLLGQAKANHYNELGRYKEALEAIDQSLALADSVNDLYQYGMGILVKASCLIHLKQYSEALRYCDIGQDIMERLDIQNEVVNCYSTRYEIYKAMGDYQTALSFYEKARTLQETLVSDEFTTKVATMNSLNELDKKDRQVALANKEKQRVETENKRRSVQLYASLVIGLLVLVLLLFSARAYRLKKKANEQLNTQKEEIAFQKHLVDEKQKEILDSIHYARRIQSTLLANSAFIRTHLPESFILFKPKDIVSGDFYWATEKDNRFYLAVCDSTGHGVPGAFMSLLNISFLNEAINDKDIREPHQILNHVRSKLIASISQDGARDGMDGILLCFDRNNGSLTYAASQNCPMRIRNGELTEFPADKMPIGNGDNLDSFSLRTIEVEQGDLLFLYTDGYADQFGGPKGKKFKYRQLEELLVANAGRSMEEQHQQLDTVFEDWRGELEQVDDVAVMGIRI